SSGGTNFPAAASDSHGDMHVAYESGMSTLAYATLSGGVWTSEIVATGLGLTDTVSLAINRDDQAVVAYGDYGADSAYHLYIRQRASAWGAAEAVVDPRCTSQPDASVAVNDKNVDGKQFLHLVYTCLVSSYQAEVRYASKATGSWVFTTVDATAVPKN